MQERENIMKSRRTTLPSSFSLLFIAISLLVNQSDARVSSKFFGSTWDNNLMDEGYYDNARSSGLDLSKAEWTLERKVTNEMKKKYPNLNGSHCTVRFLEDASKERNLALLSTGEVGEWRSFYVRPKDVRKCSYDEAKQGFCGRNIELEVKSSQNPDDSSVTVYRFSVDNGILQQKAALFKTQSTMAYYPNGRSNPETEMSGEEEYDMVEEGAKTNMEEYTTENVGMASIHVKAGRPVIDKSWAKGKRWFWTKREQAGMRNNPGYI